MLTQALESQSGFLSLFQMVKEMFICMADCSAAGYLNAFCPAGKWQEVLGQLEI